MALHTRTHMFAVPVTLVATPVLPAGADAVPPVQLLQCNSDETNALTQCQKPVKAIGDRLAQMFQVRVLV